MRILGILTVCAVMASPVASFAQESSKSASAGMDVVELITRFAKRSGKKFVIDPRAHAQVPLAGLEPGEVTYDQLLAILDDQQLAVVDSGGLLAVVPDAIARQFPTPVYTDVNFKALDHEIVTLVVTPKKACANFMVPVLRPLMPQAAHLAAEIQTNTLIINDRADNARRIAEMVDVLDQRGTGAKDCQPREAVAPPPAKPKD